MFCGKVLEIYKCIDMLFYIGLQEVFGHLEVSLYSILVLTTVILMNVITYIVFLLSDTM